MVNRYLKGFSRTVLWMALFSVEASSQTQVDLRTQSRNVDFSSALSTKPIRTGNTLPTTCSAGEAFFLITGAAGQNLNLCTAPDIWTVQGGSGTAGTQNADAGPSVLSSNSVTLGVGENCSLASPCHARIGGTAYTFVGSSAIIISSGNPTIRVYISDGSDGAPQGTLKVRNSAGGGVTCSGACVVENSQTTFPGLSIPLAIWTATVAGAWDSSGVDLRSALNATPTPVAGTGIMITQGGSTSVSVDPTVVTRKFGGSGVPGAIAGSTPGDLYIDTTNKNSYQCMSTGTCAAVGQGNWVQVVSGAGTPIDTTTVPKKYSGSGAPAVVTGSALGDLYLDVANNDTYQCFQSGGCTAPGSGNWVKIGATAGAAGPTQVSGAYIANNGRNYFGAYPADGLPDGVNFTWMNQPPGATDDVAGSHALHMYVPAPGANGDNLAVLTDSTALSTTSFTLTASFLGCTVNGSVNYSVCGIGLTDGTKVTTFGWTSVYGQLALAVTHWSSVTSPAGFGTWRYWTSSLQVSAFKIVLSGGVFTFYFSVDGGASFDAFFSESATGFFASTNGLSSCWVLDNNWSSGTGSATLTNWGIN